MATARAAAGRWWAAAFGARRTGFPTSSNGASSFHLRWLGLDTDEPLVAVSAQLEVVTPPAVDHLYFWALQATFADGSGRHGGGHLGLQWYGAHPGSTAVNWGGYDRVGGELDGTPSELPSATGNANTRDFAWRPGQPYRLRIEGGDSPGAWRGSVDGQPVRDLAAGGSHLVDVTVWSEVFARCDDPPVAVRWTDLTAVTPTGREVHPDGLAVSYQPRGDGGCDNTTVRGVDGGAEQLTSTSRDVAPGTILPIWGEA